MTTVSLCMIVRNESFFLPGALRSTAELVAETIVVDTGSEDDTVAIARDSGATVFEYRTSNLSAARNVALDNARGEWILSLDADERLTPEDCSRLRELMEGQADAYFLGVLNYYGKGKWASYPNCKFFRRMQGVRWESPIHEGVAASLVRHGAIPVASGASVHHLEIAGPDLSSDKRVRNLSALWRQLATGPTLLDRCFLALEQFCLGAPEMAIESLLRVLQDRPDHELATRFLADFRLALGDLSGARDMYAKLALIAAFEKERAYHGLATLAYLHGELAAALSYVDRCLTHAPLAHNVVNRALLLYEMGELDESDQMLRGALSQNSYLLDDEIYRAPQKYSLFPSQGSLLPAYDQIADPQGFWRGIANGQRGSDLREAVRGPA
jgi:glycosyltransferase involved in cell wall biosynthesis